MAKQGEERWNCPYCGVEVQQGDSHAQKVERRSLRGVPTIEVTCVLTRTFEVALTPLSKDKAGE
jgi:hypothetical protein